LQTGIVKAKTYGLDYEVSTLDGIVLDTQTRSETEVSGKIRGGGGSVSNGSGSISGVSGDINSTTNRFQSVFLQDDDNVEHHIDLINFLIPCKNEHRLTMFFLTVNGNDTGRWFMAYNHNTRRVYENDRAIKDEVFPWDFLGPIAAFILIAYFLLVFIFDGQGIGEALINTFLMGLVTAVVLFIPAKILQYFRSLSVQSNSALQQFVANLNS